MTNPKLIPADMRRRAEWARRRAEGLAKASQAWTSRPEEPHALDMARILADQALTLGILADELDAWADGVE